MQIQGFGQYGGFYQQSRISQIKQVSVEDVKQQDELKKQQEQKAQSVESLQKEYAPAPDNRSRMADLENISLTFNAGETYDYIGKDASLENLDMMNAISDMQKDSVLQQYQYFVDTQESVGGVIASSEDGIVIQK